MSILVTDTGFTPDDWSAPVLTLAEAMASPQDTAPLALTMDGSDDPTPLIPILRRIDMIRVNFPTFSDGRGLTLAARLRRAGFAGRLRANGPLLPDQYTMARRAGFDEVEIPATIAARHTEDAWRARADWAVFDHRAPMRQIA